jgi:mRNA turnover protein 4
MAKALGTESETEHLPGLAVLSRHIKGDVGLLLTAREPTEILEHFSGYAQTDFARAGAIATHTFTVPAGIVHSRGGAVAAEEDDPVPHSVETTLRRWGMPTKLSGGKVLLDGPHTVCKEGEVLNSNQTALLKMFGVAMAEFKVRVVAYWSGADGKVTVVDQDEEKMEE